MSPLDHKLIIFIVDAQVANLTLLLVCRLWTARARRRYANELTAAAPSAPTNR